MKTDGTAVSFLRRRWKDILLVLLFLTAVIAVLCAVKAQRSGSDGTGGAAASGSDAAETESPEKLSDSIHLPGYGSLTLKADTKEQELALSNPSENTVLIRISILLEDGTVLWTSELLKPGEASPAVLLREPLSAGEYSAVLKYECFEAEDPTKQLNGANAKLLLKVY